ncbi:MAG: hypothetical protein NVSMB65_08990 [Chloroflexota bacterium]
MVNRLERDIRGPGTRSTGRGGPRTRRGRDLERAADLFARAAGSTASLYAHVIFYGGLLGLTWTGMPVPTLLGLIAIIVALEVIFLIIFVLRSANQQAARLEEAIAVIRHNTADHLSEPLDVVVKDIRRELGETTMRVAELAGVLSRQEALQAGATTGQRAAIAASHAALHADGVEPPAETGSAVDVIVVDDDVTICELVRDVLSETGYTVVTATSGERAISMLGSYRPRLVLADLDMPAMSGWALCAWLQAHEELQHVPIILISGSTQIAREASLLGAQGYIAKPFDIDHLLRVIDTHLLVA